MDPCVNIPLDESVVEDIGTKAKDWASVHGVVLRTSEADPIFRLELAPFTLIPSTFPKKEFLKAKTIQTSLNLLLHRAAHDPDFLRTALKNTIAVDDFTARLYQVYEAVQESGANQRLSLGLLRCDYLLDEIDGNDSPVIKQVEMNTISSSFGALAKKLSAMHRYVLTELGVPELSENVPDNSSVDGLAAGLIAAWKAYAGSPNSAIVFLVEPFVRMIGDQKLLEFAIRKQNSSIRILRRTLRDFGEKGALRDQALYIEDVEVAVVYFRDCYTPHQYPLEIDWETRLMLEMSKAIKCPSIHYQLVGTKKVQQELSKPEILQRFLHESDCVPLIREAFTGLYSLDEGAEGDDAVAAAINNPQKYVLKPQREGGGNNLYGEDVKEVLMAYKNSHERAAYILMDRIRAPKTKNYIVRPNNKIEYSEVVSELGIYGVILGNESDVLLNEEVGHLLRTKPASSDEGGVVAGFAALDGMYLV